MKSKIIALTLLSSLIFVSCNKKTPIDSNELDVQNSPEIAQTTQKTESTDSDFVEDFSITREMYEKLKEGMTYDQVIEIIGNRGLAQPNLSLEQQHLNNFLWLDKNNNFFLMLSFDGTILSRIALTEK